MSLADQQCIVRGVARPYRAGALSAEPGGGRARGAAQRCRAAVLSTSRRPEGMLLPVLGVVDAGLLLCAGAWRAWREPRQTRRHAAQALRFHRDAE